MSQQSNGPALTDAQWRKAQAHPRFWHAYEGHKRRLTLALYSTEAYWQNPEREYQAACRRAEELAAVEVLRAGA